ncbi:unnamed protein product [Cutaneotrichosporon oleaginosum]
MSNFVLGGQVQGPSFIAALLSLSYSSSTPIRPVRHLGSPRRCRAPAPMAPLLLTHFRARHRSVLTTLFAATFLGAVVVVAFPCPARVGVSDGARMRLDGEQPSEVVAMMNKRGGRKLFMEE